MKREDVGKWDKTVIFMDKSGGGVDDALLGNNDHSVNP